MSKDDKLIKDLQNNPKNVRFETLEKILLSRGFALQSVKGSHHNFVKNGYLVTLPRHKPMKIFYVKLVLKSIEEQK